MEEYAQYFNESDFWKKMKSMLKSASRELLELALKLYYVTQDPETPTWVKGVAIGALGYLMMPTNLLPNFLSFLGVNNNIVVLAGAVAAVGAHITEEHKNQAQEKLAEWFGEAETGKLHIIDAFKGE